MYSSLVSRFLRASVFAGLACLVGNTGCVQDQETLIIERAVWFDDSCTLQAGTNSSLASLTADVSFTGTELAFGVIVTNNAITSPGSNTNLDDSEIYMESVDVTLGFSGGGLATSGFNVPLPTDSLRGGDSQTFLIRVPTDVAASISSQLGEGETEILEVEVVFNARKNASVTENGKLGTIQSRAYTFPLNVCNGCLRTCLSAMDCPNGTPDANGLVCPTADNWAGPCGFAVGGQVVAPECAVEG